MWGLGGAFGAGIAPSNLLAEIRALLDLLGENGCHWQKFWGF
jgi:hypothetical protein